MKTGDRSRDFEKKSNNWCFKLLTRWFMKATSQILLDVGIAMLIEITKLNVMSEVILLNYIACLIA